MPDRIESQRPESELGLVAQPVVAVRLKDAHEVGAGDLVHVAREGEGARDVVEPGKYGQEKGRAMHARRVVCLGEGVGIGEG